MNEQRKKYTPAEKAKIALEAIKGELTLAQISAPLQKISRRKKGEFWSSV